MDTDFTKLLDDSFFGRFFLAWQTLRTGEGLPSRKDVRLQDFAPFAADLLMYELISPSHLRCRLMGSRVTDRVQMSGPDINWLDHVAPDMRRAGERWWQALVNTPCAGMMQYSVAHMDGTNRMSRCLLLPITQSEGQVMLLALTQASSVYRVDDTRDQLQISEDCFQTCYLDIGFGLPPGQEVVEHHKSPGRTILERLYGDAD